MLTVSPTASVSRISFNFTRSSGFPAGLWHDGEGNPFTSFEEAFAYFSQNPDDPTIAYLLGTVPSGSSGLGVAISQFDSGTIDLNGNYQSSFDYPNFADVVSYAGMYLPQE